MSEVMPSSYSVGLIALALMIGRQLHFDTLNGNHKPFPLRVLVNAELVESAGKVMHRIDIALDAEQEAFVP